ncbi:ProQ/FINO family protein [Candidatus Thiothrix anitrata]|uniref:Fertility inhibition FinO n=1 Tax=Candidatus Thiothrix anitrata TaxID=2823902 RepID=A0ABX7X3Y3_9GAMM|nr:ProQ/FINO family protein [Candidatus Thiothrix anitrata]QTR49513.1 Fertility inhibition FinO [Candidatus Thiothrix anitrata]
MSENDTPKKTLSIIRKPSGAGATATPATRTGKRIIRRDDLPNVQRVPIPKPKPPANKTKPKKPPRKPAPKKQITPPSDLKARELNDRLNGFSVWFNFQPLAIGVDKDIYRLVNEEHFLGASKNVVQKVLKMHTNHGRYLQAIINGGARYRLEGTEEGDINPYQQQLAADTLAKRQASQH